MTGVRGPLVLHGLDEVRAAAGAELGPTEWVEVTQRMVDDFAVACPGAGMGWLLLSVSNLFMPQLVVCEGISAGLNMGTGAVRFATDDVAVGTRVRGRGRIVTVDEAKGGVQTTIELVVEVEGADAPVVTVESLSRWLE